MFIINDEYDAENLFYYMEKNNVADTNGKKKSKFQNYDDFMYFIVFK